MTGKSSDGTAGPSGPAVSRETILPADVSRETTPDDASGSGPGRESPPAGVVDQIFGARAELAERFVEHLVTTGVERGLIGPRETSRIWSRHVLNCAVLSELIPDAGTLIDVGSGAGLPGLAVAIARPDVRVTLVEPLERRTVWLQEVVDDLGLETRVVRARAEDLVGREGAQVVTARAVAPLGRLARWCLPLAEPGGQLLALKGRSAQAEIAAATDELQRAGVVGIELLTCGVAVLSDPTTVVRVALGPDGYGPTRTARSRPRRRR